MLTFWIKMFCLGTLCLAAFLRAIETQNWKLLLLAFLAGLWIYTALFVKEA